MAKLVHKGAMGMSNVKGRGSGEGGGGFWGVGGKDRGEERGRGNQRGEMSDNGCRLRDSITYVTHIQAKKKLVEDTKKIETKKTRSW